MSNKVAIIALYLILVSPVLAGEVLEDTIEKTLPLSATGTFSLKAIDGSVEIYGAETEQVQIVATRKAFSPERVNAIKIAVAGDGNSVNIDTVAPPKPRWGLRDRSGTVDYIINLPQRARITSLKVPNGELVIHGMRGAGIDASLGNGRLISHNCFCDQALKLGGGRLDLFFDWDEPRPIEIEAAVVNGNAHAIIPSDASFRLHASSARGHVASDFTQMENRKRGGMSEVNETIGPAPFSRLTIRAQEGNIQISEVL